MNLFDGLTLLGGLCFFLFGMSMMGDALEKSAGDGLKNLLAKLTTGKLKGFLTGLGVTAIIQSSSATTVMVVGFVNSGLMTLRQAINVIMGANVGTTVTAWLLSLTGIESSSLVVQMFKPTSFTPILALIGIILYMVDKNGKKRDIGMILLGFAILMFGMDTMSGAVEGLKNVEEFRNLFLLFKNPILGVLAGAVLTGIIQSSSASVGILQALSSTGQITVGATVPIIMGQNIGTCVTALLSSVGTNRNARRASLVHLSFNIIGTIVLLTAYTIVTSVIDFSFVSMAANETTIAIAHTTFNVLCTALLLPASSLLEKLSYQLIKKTPDEEKELLVELDERLMATPAIAIEQSRILASTMAQTSERAIQTALELLKTYKAEDAALVREDETACDHYEDVLGSYLVRLNTHPLSERDSNESSKLLFAIGDLERISDHAVNLLASAKEISDKSMQFSEQAKQELNTMISAVSEIIGLTTLSFCNNDLSAAAKVEPLEQVVDLLKSQLRARHIVRLQKGECSIEAGFVWADLLTDLERVSDHCSNIAGCVIEMAHESMDLHEYLHKVKSDSPEYTKMYNAYAEKYSITA